VNAELLAVIKEHTTPSEYEALELWANGHSHREAAGFLDISVGAYRKRLVRARRRIRKHMSHVPPRSY
jgi:DNA-directed RNA polymerase specialized sigma24 family protein